MHAEVVVVPPVLPRGTRGGSVAISQLADTSRVPAKARVATFAAQERYGLVWAAIEEPRWPLPEVPELEDGGWAAVTARTRWWSSRSGPSGCRSTWRPSCT